jgi:hypothetical protein
MPLAQESAVIATVEMIPRVPGSKQLYWQREKENAPMRPSARSALPLYQRTSFAKLIDGYSAGAECSFGFVDGLSLSRIA